MRGEGYRNKQRSCETDRGNYREIDRQEGTKGRERWEELKGERQTGGIK